MNDKDIEWIGCGQDHHLIYKKDGILMGVGKNGMKNEKYQLNYFFLFLTKKEKMELVFFIIFFLKLFLFIIF